MDYITVKKTTGKLGEHTKHEIKAHVYGNLAIHRNPDDYENDIVISHVPTGYRVLSGFKLKRDAVVVINKLLIASDWSFKTTDDPEIKTLLPLVKELHP